MTAFPTNIDLAVVDGDDGYRLDGGGGRSATGDGVVALGDVNGDGIADLGIMSGSEEIVWTGRWGPFDAANAIGRSFPFDDGRAALPDNVTFFDGWLAGIGDVDGDGFADFDHHVVFETVIHYDYEGDSWSEIHLHDYAEIRLGGTREATNGVRFGDQGLESAEELFLDPVGDINGDGFDDVALSIYGGFFPGRTHKVVFGSESGLVSNANRDSAPSLQFSWSTVTAIRGAGDVNGDGIADLVVQAFEDGGWDHYIVFGGSDLVPGVVDLHALDGSSGFKLAGADGARAVGDLNGDGLDDLLVSMEGTSDDGTLYVVFGRSDVPAVVDASTVAGAAGFRLVGVAGDVSGAGDVDGDGRDDLLVSLDGGPQDAVIFMPAVVGAEGLNVAAVDGGNGFQIVATELDLTGWTVIAAGDVNGDGFDDLAVGLRGENAVYVVLGHAGAAVNRLGTSAPEHVTGSLGDDVLNGAGGNDYLSGLDGDDLLIGGSGGDILSGGAGIDTASFLSGAQGVAVDLVAGTAVGIGLGHDTLIGIENVVGSKGDDDIMGSDDANRIDGDLGADRMAGGGGGDTYVVDDVGDQVVESRNQGHDLVETSLAELALAHHVEDLIYMGGGDFLGTGNRLANLIVGGSGDDVLNGSLGGDTLRGGAGDDIYVVDQGGDMVEEEANSGFDTVRTEWSYTLGDHVEALALRGTAGSSGTGNGLDNTLSGNGAGNVLTGLGGDDSLQGKAGNDRLLGGDGDDRLDGGSGDDILRGGLGDDLYGVDSAGDLLSEAGGGGIDTVRSSIGFTLGSGFEILALVTSQDVNATGNSAANVLEGGNGDNVLAGMRGNDTLTGNGGADVFVFGAGFGRDRITDFSSSDRIRFDGGLFADFADVLAHATQVGAAIVIAPNGSNAITIDNYQLGDLNAGDFLFA